MKKFLLLLLLPLIFSCTNYYSVTLIEDAPLYKSQAENGTSIIVVPKGETVYITGGTKSYRKIKYGTYKGWVYNPVYSGSTDKSDYKSTSTYKRSSSSSNSSSSKTVHVKGYTRKDGTYVKPHTRSAPKRKH